MLGYLRRLCLLAPLPCLQSIFALPYLLDAAAIFAMIWRFIMHALCKRPVRRVACTEEKKRACRVSKHRLHCRA